MNRQHALFECDLRIDNDKFAPLGSDQLFNRLRQLARLIGLEPVIET